MAPADGSSDGPRRLSSASRRKRSPMVLVVVADPATRDSYVTQLRDNGFTVMDAARGADAIGLAARFVPEIVVVDLDMPGLAGLSVVRQVRSELKRTAIVALARELTPHRENIARTTGCDAVLEAPCPPETLLTELLIVLADLDPLSGQEDASSA